MYCKMMVCNGCKFKEQLSHKFKNYDPYNNTLENIQLESEYTIDDLLEFKEFRVMTSQIRIFMMLVKKSEQQKIILSSENFRDEYDYAKYLILYLKYVSIIDSDILKEVQYTIIDSKIDFSKSSVLHVLNYVDKKDTQLNVILFLIEYDSKLIENIIGTIIINKENFIGLIRYLKNNNLYSYNDIVSTIVRLKHLSFYNEIKLKLYALIDNFRFQFIYNIANKEGSDEVKIFLDNAILNQI